jgi:hypothetical protein
LSLAYDDFRFDYLQSYLTELCAMCL